MQNGILTTTALIWMAATTPARAGIYAFGRVSSSNQNTRAYGLTAPANLTRAATTGPWLCSKNGGAGNHEISAALQDGSRIDFSNAMAAGPIAMVTTALSNAQSGEGWALYRSNTVLPVAGDSQTAGDLGEPLLNDSGSNARPAVGVTLPDWGQYTYYTLMAPDPGKRYDAKVVKGTATIDRSAIKTSAPEPGSLVLAGTALLTIGFVMKKKT